MRADFRWEDARRQPAGLPGGGVDIAHGAVDQHAAGPLRDGVAPRGAALVRTEELTYDDLRRATKGFTNVLGAGGRDRVATLLGRVPALCATALGTLKNTSVHAPLFSAFGPEPVRERPCLGGVRVLVTTPQLHRRRRWTRTPATSRRTSTSPRSTSRPARRS